jgi:hypothetical protein
MLAGVPPQLASSKGEIMRCLVLAVVALFFLAGSAGAQNTDPPMFSAFRQFCVVTDAKPSAVKSAIEGAGGILRTASDAPEYSGSNVEIITTTWDYTTDGTSMVVTVRAHRVLGSGPTGEMTDEFCGIRSNANEDASVDALIHWIGVPPIHAQRKSYISPFAQDPSAPDARRDVASQWFCFLDVAGRHSPCPEDGAADAEKSSSTRGEAVWVISTGSSAQFYYFH